MIHSSATAARQGTALFCRKIGHALTSWHLAGSLPPVAVFAPYALAATLKMTGALA